MMNLNQNPIGNKMLQEGKTFLINRDPSGYVFLEDGKFKRQVSPSFQSTFDKSYNQVIKSKSFADDILPINKINNTNDIVLEVSQLDFSYLPHEMPFSLLKKTALFHLDLCQRLLRNNFILKDARPENYQLFEGQVVLIDHLSIIPYSLGAPLFCYRDFIERFIGPMILFSSNLKSTFSVFDRVPLPEIKRLAPFSKNFNLHFFVNVVMHSYFYDRKEVSNKAHKITKERIFGILQSLMSLVKSIHIANDSPWKDYSDESEYQQKKIETINHLLGQSNYKRILNLGSNLSPNLGEHVPNSLILHIERDAQVASQLHDGLMKTSSTNQLAINMNVLDIFKNIGEFSSLPPPSLVERFRPDCILLSSIIHHLYDQTNLSVDYIIKQWSTVNTDVIIEYVSIDDLDHFSNDLIPRHPYPKVDEFERILKKHYRGVIKKGSLSSSRELFLATHKSPSCQQKPCAS